MNRAFRLVALPGFFIFAAAAVHAQGPGVAIGLKSGVNVADIRISDDFDTETSSRIGFIGGGVLSLMPSPIFAIQPEILYSQQGASLSENGDEVTLETDYIQVPVLFKLSVPTTGQVTPMFYAGPVFSFESSCSVVGEFEASVSVSCDDSGVERETTDVGVNVGAGLNFDIGTSAFISLEGRANLGLTDLDTDVDSSAKTQVFSFLAGFGIRLR